MSFGNNRYWTSRWVTSHYRLARQNLLTWRIHYGIYNIQGFPLLQDDSRSEYKQFLVLYKFFYQKLNQFGITLPERVPAFFVLNIANRSEETKKFARMTCTMSMYTAMKDTLKTLFSDISSIEYKTVPAIKEEVELVNFNQHWNSREQKTYWGNKTNPIDRPDKIILWFKCNLAKHFAQDCSSFSSRNYINTVMDSDQAHFSLFNDDSCYWIFIND